MPVREQLSQTHAHMLQQLVDRLAARHEYRSAIDYAIRLRSYDPFREISYRRLMELYEAHRRPRGGAARLSRLSIRTRARTGRGAKSGNARRLRTHRQPRRAPMVHRQSLAACDRRAGERLVGRQTSGDILQDAWQTARQGHPHMVLIRGEGGYRQDPAGRGIADLGQPEGHLTVRTAPMPPRDISPMHP